MILSNEAIFLFSGGLISIDGKLEDKRRRGGAIYIISRRQAAERPARRLRNVHPLLDLLVSLFS